MKKFTNDLVSIEFPDIPKGAPLPKDLPSCYVDLAIIAVKNPPSGGGFNTDEMRKRFRILDTLEGAKVGATISLEDADMEKLKSCVESMNWKFMDRGILKFSETIAGI